MLIALTMPFTAISIIVEESHKHFRTTPLFIIGIIHGWFFVCISEL